MSIRSLGHTQVLRRGSDRAGTSNEECHTPDQIQALSLLDGHKIKWKEIFKWINNPQNTAAWGCIKSGTYEPLTDLFQALWCSVSIPGNPWVRSVFFSVPRHLSSIFGMNPEADVTGHPRLCEGHLASNPHNSEQSQIQVETSEQVRVAGFLPCGRRWRLPEETFISQMTAEGTRVYRKAESGRLLTALALSPQMGGIQRSGTSRFFFFLILKRFLYPSHFVLWGSLAGGHPPCILISVEGILVRMSP